MDCSYQYQKWLFIFWKKVRILRNKIDLEPKC